MSEQDIFESKLAIEEIAFLNTNSLPATSTAKDETFQQEDDFLLVTPIEEINKDTYEFYTSGVKKELEALDDNNPVKNLYTQLFNIKQDSTVDEVNEFLRPVVKLMHNIKQELFNLLSNGKFENNEERHNIVEKIYQLKENVYQCKLIMHAVKIYDFAHVNKNIFIKFLQIADGLERMLMATVSISLFYDAIDQCNNPEFKRVILEQYNMIFKQLKKIPNNEILDIIEKNLNNIDSCFKLYRSLEDLEKTELSEENKALFSNVYNSLIQAELLLIKKTIGSDYKELELILDSLFNSCCDPLENCYKDVFNTLQNMLETNNLTEENHLPLIEELGKAAQSLRLVLRDISKLHLSNRPGAQKNIKQEKGFSVPQSQPLDKFAELSLKTRELEVNTTDTKFFNEDKIRKSYIAEDNTVINFDEKESAQITLKSIFKNIHKFMSKRNSFTKTQQLIDFAKTYDLDILNDSSKLISSWASNFSYPSSKRTQIGEFYLNLSKIEFKILSLPHDNNLKYDYYNDPKTQKIVKKILCELNEFFAAQLETYQGLHNAGATIYNIFVREYPKEQKNALSMAFLQIRKKYPNIFEEIKTDFRGCVDWLYGKVLELDRAYNALHLKINIKEEYTTLNVTKAVQDIVRLSTKELQKPVSVDIITYYRIQMRELEYQITDLTGYFYEGHDPEQDPAQKEAAAWKRLRERFMNLTKEIINKEYLDQSSKEKNYKLCQQVQQEIKRMRKKHPTSFLLDYDFLITPSECPVTYDFLIQPILDMSATTHMILPRLYLSRLLNRTYAAVRFSDKVIYSNIDRFYEYFDSFNESYPNSIFGIYAHEMGHVQDGTTDFTSDSELQIYDPSTTLGYRCFLEAYANAYAARACGYIVLDNCYTNKIKKLSTKYTTYVDEKLIKENESRLRKHVDELEAKHNEFISLSWWHFLKKNALRKEIFDYDSVKNVPDEEKILYGGFPKNMEDRKYITHKFNQLKFGEPIAKEGELYWYCGEDKTWKLFLEPGSEPDKPIIHEF